MKTQFMPKQHRAATIAPATYNAEARSVEVVWTTGAKVRRYDWWNDTSYDEELVVSSDAVDLTRLNSGNAPVLNTHSNYTLENIIGVVERAWIDGAEGRAVVRLSEREDIAGIVADIAGGIIRNISAGYTVAKYEVVAAANRTDGGTVPLYRAVAWCPAEISFVPIPADAGSSTRGQPSQGSPCEFVRASAQIPQEIPMDDDTSASGGAPTPIDNSATLAQATRVATQRASDITALCLRHGMADKAVEIIASAQTVDQVREHILNEIATRDAATGGRRNVRIETVTDEMQTRMAGMEQAISNRIDAQVKLDDNGRQFRGMSLLEIGRDFLEASGVKTRGLDRLTLAQRMLHFRADAYMGTSDFASLFSNVANKRLRNAYDQNPGTYGIWARRAPNAPDFKSMQVTTMSGAPDLLQTNEAGEFKYGSMSDGKETYGVLTYGRIVPLSRQAIINDDLRAFDRLITAFGFSARRLENRTVYAQLTANAALSDTVALFHANHSNLGTGGGSALAAAGLATARTAMRLQKGLQSEELNLAPAYLIVPAALEQTAYQLTSNQYTPATAGTINEFRQGGRTALTPVVEPVLDANSSAYWYLAADSNQIDTVEYCYLDGAEGVVIETDLGFETDGISYKARLDFAAKAIDYRGLYRANGA